MVALKNRFVKMVKLYKVIGEEIIDEMLIAGIAIIIFLMGVNYFELEYAWVQIISNLSAASGLSSTTVTNEVSLMLAAIGNTFPFNYLFGEEQNITIAIIVAIIFTGLGFLFKVWTTKTKEKFIEDLGHELMVPSVIGFFTILVLQIYTAMTIHGYFAARADVLPITSNFQSGLFIWNTFGSFFITGAVALVLGSVLLVVAKSKHVKYLVIVGRTMVVSSYFLIGYYIFIRILGLKVVIESGAGDFLKYFIISGDISNFVIILCVFMFTFGRELKRYGKYLRVRKKWIAKTGTPYPQSFTAKKSKKPKRPIPKAPSAGSFY